MKDPPRQFATRSADLLARNPGVRDSVTAAALSFDAHRRRAYAEIDADAVRDWARAVKSHALTRLPDLLEEAERTLTASGVRVHWADAPEDVHAILDAVVPGSGACVVKGKSMLSEEMGVNAYLEGSGHSVFETDLGEYIIQLLREPPSHIVGPAIHRSLEDVRALFHEALGTRPAAEPDELAAAARDVLRETFLSADVGITGGNFLVAESGSLVLMENEGNIRLTTSLPDVHVALVGIEKILPRWADVATFVQLTARAATGQPVSNYVSAVRRARTEEPHGPAEVHVVFVDHGRSTIFADPVAWEALRCVRCGACLNVCPVFRQTGGHPYGWVYSGPIGAALAPGMLGLEEGHTLAFASSLCGACTDVCPVRIPIHEILLEWRRRSQEEGLGSGSERRLLELFAATARRPRLFRAAGRTLTTLPVLGRIGPAAGKWAQGRVHPSPSDEPFLRRGSD